MSQSEVLKTIPHRPPFLFVDELVSVDAQQAVTRRTFREDEDFYDGHYPDNPITPGVLICEAAFQTGAIWIGQQQPLNETKVRTPVLTRINDARFKRMVKPGDTLEITASFDSERSGFTFMKAVARCEGKTVLTVDFVLGFAEGK